MAVVFTADNYQSFLTPDSRLKERKGGKGVGRLAWLKVFGRVEVSSTLDGGSIYTRHFRFRLADHDQVEEIAFGQADPSAPIKTTISFRDYDGTFSGKCPSKPENNSLANLISFCAVVYKRQRAKNVYQRRHSH